MREQQRRIFIVEADFVARRILQGVFEARPNVRAIFASSVVTACSMLNELAIAGATLRAVLADYALPDGDGFDALRHARQLFPDVPRFLMLTVPPSLSDQELGAAGSPPLVSDFLQKAALPWEIGRWVDDQ